MVGLAMIIPLFVPSRWRRVRSAVGPSNQGIVASHPDLESTQTIPGDSGLLSDWSATQTRPQQQVDPDAPGGSQAPWGPADYS
jgi:hypothetical protein